MSSLRPVDEPSRPVDDREVVGQPRRGRRSRDRGRTRLSRDFGRDGHEGECTEVYVGTSGWCTVVAAGVLPGQRKPGEFLGHYAERLPSVELNSTGYRIPAEDQFRRWAEQTPSGFRAVKMQAYQLRQAATFEERVRLLGERLGRFASSSPRRATRGSSRSRSARSAPIFGSRSTSGTSRGRASSSRERGPGERARSLGAVRYLRFATRRTRMRISRIAGEVVRCSRLGSRSTRTSATRTSRRAPRTRSGCSSSA